MSYPGCCGRKSGHRNQTVREYPASLLGSVLDSNSSQTAPPAGNSGVLYFNSLLEAVFCGFLTSCVVCSESGPKHHTWYKDVDTHGGQLKE